MGRNFLAVLSNIKAVRKRKEANQPAYWRCCNPLLGSFLSSPPEVRKIYYEMVLNNEDTAA